MQPMQRSNPVKARRRFAVALAAAAAGLAACGTSPPTRFFTLEPVAPATSVVATYSGPPLQVRAIHLPPAWDRLELVRELTPGQLQVRDFDQWAAPLGPTARQSLTQSLAARLPAGKVVFPDAPSPADTAEVSVDILSIHIDSRSAVMQVSWSMRMPSPSTAGWRTSTLRLEAAATGDASDATALALSTLLGQLADAIAADLH